MRATEEEVAWALNVINSSEPDYQELCMWQIVNWAYWRETQKANMVAIPEEYHLEALHCESDGDDCELLATAAYA